MGNVAEKCSKCNKPSRLENVLQVVHAMDESEQSYEKIIVTHRLCKTCKHKFLHPL